MSKKLSWGLHVGLLLVCFLVVIGLMSGNAFAKNNHYKHKHHKHHKHKHHKKGPSCEKAENMKIIGYHDIQGRETLQVTTNGDWAFAGHHNRPGWVPIHYNPMTRLDEENGTSIFDVSNPKKPKLVVHIPQFDPANPASPGNLQQNRNSRSTSVVYNFLDSGKDILVRNSEASNVDYFQVFDITDIIRNGGTKYIEMAKIRSTVPVPGEDGTLTSAHKGYLSPSGMYYATGTESGINQHLLVWDLSILPSINEDDYPVDLGPDEFVGRGWIEGQQTGDPLPEYEAEVGPPSMHHPIVDEENDRVYGAFLTGGDVASFNVGVDVSGDPNRRFPVAWEIDTAPPGRGTHTVAPVVYDHVANFGEDALPRVYALVADEAVGGDIKCPNPVRTKNYMMDITDADRFTVIGVTDPDPPDLPEEIYGTGYPFPVDTWQVPDGDFCERGGRFGPHQFNETINSQLNPFADKIAYFAYFNAGVRAVDISDPYDMEEVGYCVPRATDGTHGINQAGQDAGELVIQINDVDTDYRGLVYATDRVGSGFFILKLEN